MKPFDSVLVEVNNGIATVSLHRPKAGNSFDGEFFKEVAAAIELCDTDEDVQVILLTGSGKNFSVGGDIQQMSSFDFLTYDVSILSGAMTASVRKCTKPVVAVINGTAAGAGCALALACDFRIMTKKSVLMTAFSNVGLCGDSGCIYHLYHLVGLAKTIEMMALSEPIKGEEALRLGLATKMVEEDALMEEALLFAEKLKNRPLAAIAMQKKMYWDTFYHDYDAFCRLEAELFVKSSKTEDHAEAVTAFLAKRKPVFRGR
ncbi:MAG: enoyl-CoA hydratase/isomerase family protein [Anaerotignum sp.]|nr:enoyl-CoA hydratase/isomerase family protein [Anaerotignum sp.]